MPESNGIFLSSEKDLVEALKNNALELAPDTSQPYSDWTILSSHDTGSQCEQEKGKVHGIAAHAKERGYRDWKGQPLEQRMKLATKAFEFALCIATDDPRLKGK